MITTFKENIIKELGLESLSEEKKMEIVLNIGRIIQQNVILRILDELKDERDKDEFDELLGKKGDDEQAILKFLQSKIPNLDEIVNEEIVKFKQENIDFMKKVTQ